MRFNSVIRSLALLAVCAAAPGLAQKPAAGSLVAAFAAESTVLDPIKYSAGVDHYFMGQMFEQLVRPDASQKTVNWLAESWEVKDAGGKPIIDIRIRKGVKFHNGDPLTSRDFEFAQRKLADPKISR